MTSDRLRRAAIDAATRPTGRPTGRLDLARLAGITARRLAAPHERRALTLTDDEVDALLAGLPDPGDPLTDEEAAAATARAEAAGTIDAVDPDWSEPDEVPTP